MIKRWDIIIIVLLVLISFLPFAIFSYQQTGLAKEGSELVAIITVDNEVIKEINLTGHEGTDIHEIVLDDGDYNTIEVKNEQIRVKAANCPDQVDVLTGFVSKPGQTIICLPHRLVVEIQTKSGETEEDIIVSS